MDPAVELRAYELRRHHHDRTTSPDTLARAALVAARRQRHRHRFAERLRAVAERLDS